MAQLNETAERTSRTPRQVVELALQRVLPMVESGFLDSQEGQRMLAGLEESIERGQRPAAEIENAFRSKPGPPKKETEKPRKLAVFRLDADLLARVRSAAQKTGRNDRQIVEMCLRWGVPLAETWFLIEPVLDQLKAAWGQLRTTLAGGTSSVPREKLEAEIREAMFHTVALVLPRLVGKEMTPEESDGLRTKMFGTRASPAPKPAKKKPGK